MVKEEANKEMLKICEKASKEMGERFKTAKSQKKRNQIEREICAETDRIIDELPKLSPLLEELIKTGNNLKNNKIYISR